MHRLIEYNILFKLWERRHKKKVEIVVTKDENLLKFFNRFKFIHKADVVDRDDARILSLVDQVQA